MQKTFTIGTRRYFERKLGDWRVVCATCGAGGVVKHTTQDSAGKAAARDSGKACRTCGAH